MVTPISVDAGNAGTKISALVNGKIHDYFMPSFCVPLTRSQWDNVVARSEQTGDYAVINGIPFAFGRTALQYSLIATRDVARYTRDFLGAILAFGCARLKVSGQISAMVLHPPRNIAFRNQIYNAVSGAFEVITYHGQTRKSRKFSIQVGAVTTLDEPLGGLTRAMLGDSWLTSKPVPDPRFKGIRNLLVLDVGGNTTDAVGIQSNHVIVESFVSVPLGVNGLMNSVREYINNTQNELVTMANNPHFDDAVLMQAFQDRFIQIGGHKIELAPKLVELFTALANNVSMLMKTSEYASSQGLVITGGGGALIESFLRVQHKPFFGNNIFLAETPKDMAFANARGGLAILAMSQTMGKNRRGVSNG